MTALKGVREDLEDRFVGQWPPKGIQVIPRSTGACIGDRRAGAAHRGRHRQRARARPERVKWVVEDSVHNSEFLAGQSSLQRSQCDLPP